MVGAGVISLVAALGMLLSRDVRTLEHRPDRPAVEPEPEAAVAAGADGTMAR
jgi:hypothetical protein